MKKGLRSMNGERYRFHAKIDRFGKKTSYTGGTDPTILLKDIKLVGTDKILADHVWFAKGKSWKSCSVGDCVEFDARVVQYEKGYKGYRDDVIDSPIMTDYTLERPTKIKRIKK